MLRVGVIVAVIVVSVKVELVILVEVVVVALTTCSTLPPAGVAHLSPVVSALSAVKTVPLTVDYLVVAGGGGAGGVEGGGGGGGGLRFLIRSYLYELKINNGHSMKDSLIRLSTRTSCSPAIPRHASISFGP